MQTTSEQKTAAANPGARPRLRTAWPSSRFHCSGAIHFQAWRDSTFMTVKTRRSRNICERNGDARECSKSGSAGRGKMRVDKTRDGPTFSPPFQAMSTIEQKQQTPTPAEIPFTTPQLMSRYVTDTGK